LTKFTTVCLNCKTVNKFLRILGPARPLSDTSQNVMSEQVVAWARQSISSCNDEHIICKNGAITAPAHPFRPTRLLKIDKESGNLRLVSFAIVPREMEPDSTQEIQSPQSLEDAPAVKDDQDIATELTTGDEKVEYLALSHCWGGEIECRLRKTNLSQNLESIDINGLPRNFQHAFSITCQLGYDYLWIDSLCIVQDDPVDWEKESAKMGLVYSNAACVISAIGAANSHGGCFFAKDSTIQDVVVRRNSDFALTICSWIREDRMLEKLFDEGVEKAPLSYRGWAFQERILAKRILHFSRGGILFECNTHRASEYHVDGIPYPIRTSVRGDGKVHSTDEIQRLLAPEKQYEHKKKLIYHSGTRGYKGSKPTPPYYASETRVVRNLDYKSQREKVSEIIRLSAHLGMRGSFEMLLRFAGSSTIEQLEFHHSWFEMIEQYSARDLSEPSDKLMAITGIAALIQQTTKLTFIAGLWKEALALNLLWSTIPMEKRSDRPVPSWSWVSVDGQVNHHLKHSEEAIPQLAKLSVSPEGSTLPSKFASQPRTELFETSWQNVSLYVSRIAVDKTLEIDSLIHNATLRITCHLAEMNLFDKELITYQPDVTTEIPSSNLWYMPVVSFQRRLSSSSLCAREVHGLVITMNPNGSFQRAGYFWTLDEGMITKLKESGLQKHIRLI
jgi:Heterokaryon incompatibility protein (HET)